MRRLPVQPLFDEVNAHRHTDTRLALMFGVDRVTIPRWRKRGSLPMHIAERACDAAGTTPYAVWGDTYMLLAMHPKDRRELLETAPHSDRVAS